MALKLRATRSPAQGKWTNVPCPPGHDTTGSSKTRAPASFKRLLGARLVRAALSGYMNRSHNTNDRAGDNERTADATECGIWGGATRLPRDQDPEGELVCKPATGGTSQAADCYAQRGVEAALSRLIPEPHTGARESSGSDVGTGVGARESGREALPFGSMSWRPQGDHNQDTKAELFHCGRLTDRASAAGDSLAGAVRVDEVPCPPGHDPTVSIKTRAPASCKRMLGRGLYARSLNQRRSLRHV